MGIPSMPAESRSSRIRVWVAAVPSSGILNSTDTFFSSSEAFLVPARAIVQKSEALLVTKASFSFLSAAWAFSPRPNAATRQKVKRNQRTRGYFIRGGFIVSPYRSDCAQRKEQTSGFEGALQVVLIRSAH